MGDFRGSEPPFSLPTSPIPRLGLAPVSPIASSTESLPIPPRPHKPTTSTRPVVEILSSIPIDLEFSSFSSAESHRPPKRQRNGLTQPPNPPNLTLSDLVLQAKDLLVQAYTLTGNRAEQIKLLDLLEVFREYTEKGHIRYIAFILRS